MPRSNAQKSTTRTRRRASITVVDIQAPETPHPRRPVLPSQPNSEPANLPTRRRSRLPTVSSRARHAGSETDDDTEDDDSNAEDDDSDAEDDDSDAEDDDSGAEDDDSDADDDNSNLAGWSRPPRTPCPTCHRGARGLHAKSQSSSRPSSPDDSSDQTESDSDVTLDLSSLSLGESTVVSPIPSIDFQKENSGPIARILIDEYVFQAICHKALDLKTARKGDDGYVYIMADASQPGYVKIGQTGKNPYDRCKEIQRSCKKVFPKLIENQDFTVLPCCYRLEQIIFADLWEEKQFFLCNCRNNKHVEWFKMSKEDALSRVKLWQEWMRQKPYDSNGVLEPKWQQRIEKLQRDSSYAETTEAEHASGNPWQTFMAEFPDPAPS